MQPLCAASVGKPAQIIRQNVATIAFTVAGYLLVALFLDGRVRPHAAGFLPIRSSPAGSWLTVLVMTIAFGVLLAVCGNAAVAACLALALLTLLVLASNAKHAMLGEPLLFSDLALIGAVFRHPQFYLSAIAIWQRVMLGVAAVALIGLLWWLSLPGLALRGVGVIICLGASVGLVVAVRIRPVNGLALRPDAHADVLRLGLLPTLLLYWLRWRGIPDPPPCPAASHLPLARAPELVVVVQCESFADPVQLFGDPALALPGLEYARRRAVRHGRLDVSGFGAYTMRTEYGVLFGRNEDALGFRRYDPYLTATGEGSYALPARLAPAGWRSLFVHPHDLGFYGRDRIMPAAGFNELVGEDRFAPPAPGEGRYVTDAAIADRILELARDARQPSLIYAVTIENHGPWAAPADSVTGSLLQSYLRLVRNSDAMLTALLKGLQALDRPAMLVFFGDHRPSIPGCTDPFGDRHTPYVMVRTDEAVEPVGGKSPQVDLAPSQLHQAILDAVLGVRN